MNAEVGTKTCPAVQRVIKRSKHLSHTWKDTEGDGINESVGCLQAFNEKSQISLFVVAL